MKDLKAATSGAVGRARAAASRATAGDLDVVALALLLLLTACFGRAFSYIGFDGPSIYVTEVVLLIVGVAALVRVGVGGAIGLIRERLPVVGLLLLVTAGVVAAARGLVDLGLSETLNDIGLLEYTLVLPLVVVVANTAGRRDLLLYALAIGGFGGALAFGISDLAFRIGEVDPPLADQEGTLGLLGFYGILAVAWIGARTTHGYGRPAVSIAILAVLLTLVVLANKSSIWLAGLAALAVVVIAAPAGRRLLAVGATALALMLGLGGAVAVERTAGERTPGQVQTESEPEPDKRLAKASTGDGSALGSEIGGVTGSGEGGSSANTRWRIAYWGELLSRVPDNPVFGVGFGEPTRFVWEGNRYDFRDGNPENWSDVSGPHNGFISIIYRMGIVGFAGIALILFGAGWRAVSLLRSGALDNEQRSRFVALLAMLLAATVIVAFNQALEGPFISLIFWSALALVFAWAATAKRDETA